MNRPFADAFYYIALLNPNDEHIAAEFRQFLSDAGCPPAIVNQAGY